MFKNIRFIENMFGIFAARCRIFLTAINLQPNSIGYVVMARCVLNNYLLSKVPGCYASSDYFEQEHKGEGTITIEEMCPSCRRHCEIILWTTFLAMERYLGKKDLFIPLAGLLYVSPFSNCSWKKGENLLLVWVKIKKKYIFLILFKTYIM